MISGDDPALVSQIHMNEITDVIEEEKSVNASQHLQKDGNVAAGSSEKEERKMPAQPWNPTNFGKNKVQI